MADGFADDNAPKNPRARRLVNDIVAAMLRLATRDFASATERPEIVGESCACRNILADRFKARLTRAQLAEVNKHLRAVREAFISDNHARRSELCTLTVLLTLGVDESE